jgi:hypothetical protein
MSVRQPLESAAEVARGLLRPSVEGISVPTVADLHEAVRRFAEIEFDVPDSPDSDGFLFQYGEVNWLPEPTFIVGFVRQLEVSDENGQHEYYSQVLLEYRYGMDEGLGAVGGHEDWWFRDGPTNFEEWVGLVERDSIWSLVGRRRPYGFEVLQDQV